MGYMKELDIRIRNGGDDAIAAACELAWLAKERRGYEDTMNATEDITDIVTVLRGVGFSAVSPQAGDSASMLHYCVTHAADEIEHLRNERRWVPVTERLPEPVEHDFVGEQSVRVLAWSKSNGLDTAWFYRDEKYGDRWGWECTTDPTHWMPLPAPPTDDK
jgi:hypothetical protein